MSKILAVITARGGSKGIPLKNIKLLNNIPMINYTIEAALQCRCIDEVIVSTDHNEIADISIKAGAQVPFIRPAELSTDYAKSIDVVIHAIKHYEKENNTKISHLILLQPTSPLRTAEDIDNAWEIYLNAEADSLQSVVETNDHPYYLREIRDGLLVNYNKEELRKDLRRQDLELLYRVNGAIYIANRDLIMNCRTFVGDKNAAYIMSRERSIDIDDMLDFRLAKMLFKQET
ncbi:acylneuraminate cytidylyltransferase family protein [Paenibacillus motobuensis]|uniref:acylneuraminate cytidylyltransferase family protein n=1 Tax=Paenibacillus TaxID=44249 RepID=UPI00203D4A90|nr:MULTISPECIES: acylneuraminate cytidylyltransferase family protein [Paenibacillus]MCM3040927.1 acylneuraminate cytidylyltransferase family protein [Paenibacillus lutimineralis]MCM3648031.1 acylneuraminate cytidylyltransferase family protein [Paenibacillus motobuensis]